MDILFARRFDVANTHHNIASRQPKPSMNILHSEDKFVSSQSLGDGQKLSPKNAAFGSSIFFGQREKLTSPVFPAAADIWKKPLSGTASKFHWLEAFSKGLSDYKDEHRDVAFIVLPVSEIVEHLGVETKVVMNFIVVMQLAFDNAIFLSPDQQLFAVDLRAL